MNKDEQNRPFEGTPIQTQKYAVKWLAVLGFLSGLAGTVLIILVSFFTFIVASRGLKGTWFESGFHILMWCSFACNVASGPATGLLIWLVYRKSMPHFARGAMIYAVFAFFLFGLYGFVVIS
jgi:hypothetical protein